jgi:hypothetical protein
MCIYMTYREYSLIDWQKRWKSLLYLIYDIISFNYETITAHFSDQFLYVTSNNTNSGRHYFPDINSKPSTVAMFIIVNTQ